MVKRKDLKTGFLFATPSMIAGAARLLDLWGVFDHYNTADSEEEADALAVYSDWRIIGQDLRDAMNDFSSHCRYYEGNIHGDINARNFFHHGDMSNIHVSDPASGVGRTAKVVCCSCGTSIDNISTSKMAAYPTGSFSMWVKPNPTLERWRCLDSTPTATVDLPKQTGKSLE